MTLKCLTPERKPTCRKKSANWPRIGWEDIGFQTGLGLDETSSRLDFLLNKESRKKMRLPVTWTSTPNRWVAWLAQSVFDRLLLKPCFVDDNRLVKRQRVWCTEFTEKKSTIHWRQGAFAFTGYHVFSLVTGLRNRHCLSLFAFRYFSTEELDKLLFRKMIRWIDLCIEKSSYLIKKMYNDNFFRIFYRFHSKCTSIMKHMLHLRNFYSLGGSTLASQPGIDEAKGC